MSEPLSGIRVVQVGGGPVDVVGMVFRDMGADVLKIEGPAGRRVGGLGMTTSYLDRGKLTFSLNLKDTRGREVFRHLAIATDVVIEGFRPGVMARLGVGYDQLQSVNPRLVYCALSGYGQDGPYAGRPGHDANYLAISGLLSLLGSRDHEPVMPLNLVSDYAGAALHAVIGILLALFARERTGEGQLVDVSYLDATIALLFMTPNGIAFMEEGVELHRGQGVFGNIYPYYGVYEASDGKEISIAPMEKHFWERFCDAIERPDLKPYGFRPGDHVRAPSAEVAWAREQVAAAIKERRQDEWLRLLLDADVPCAPINSVEQAVHDPQVRHRKMVLPAPGASGSAGSQPGIPIRLSGTPGSMKTSPATETDVDALLASLGYSTEDIGDLHREHVI